MNSWRAMHRRDWLQATSCGFGYLAASALASKSAAKEGSAPISRAKRVIFLFMQGGPSQVDTFDYKPRLAQDDGQQMDFADARVIANTGNVASQHRVMKSPWKFQQHGRSGQWVSELFPHTARHVDDLCLVRSLKTEGVAHGPATLFLHCGATNFIRPSMGSWILYGLGSENENLPGFVSIGASAGNGGPRNYGTAFLPAIYQGTVLGKAGAPANDTTIKNLVADRSPEARARQFQLLQALNREQVAAAPANSEWDAVLESYELAWRMQSTAPDVLDLTRESNATLEMYGIGAKETDDFGRKCLLARRLCESGVRYIQVTYGDNTANPAWDQHSNLPKHADHALACDLPIAGLLADLKQRGLLEDTLVWWGGEFGRTPYAQQNGTGRDHNPDGFTMWLAGAGVKPGFAFGETDEFGHRATQDIVHMHDLHATILHLLGLDHEQLTYRYAGRNFRLTDVHGRVVRELLS